jgi:UDP-glucose 4-epimerase
MNNLKIGILGANGFIGKSLAKKLENNSKVCELHLYSRTESVRKNIASSTFSHKFELKKENNKIPISLFEIDILYYLISDSIPAHSWDNPTKEISNNLIPVINLIENIKEGKLKKIIFTSSAGTIYGPSNQKINEDGQKKPFSPHGIIKLTTEYFLEYFKNKYNINYSIYRISNIYGPGQNTKKGLGLINTLLEKHLKNEEVIIYGDGSIMRNYIYIEDVVDILTREINSESDNCKILNLASSYHLSINQIIEEIEKLTSKKIKIKNVKTRTADNPIIMIDNTKLISIYPDFKNTSIKNGIQQTIEALL